MSDMRAVQSGISLVEAMVAMVILSVGLLGAAMMQANISSSALVSKQRGEALSLANDRLEQKRAEIAASATPSCTAASTTENVEGVTTTYALATAIVCSGSLYQSVTYTVVWNDSSGDSNNVTLATDF